MSILSELLKFGLEVIRDVVRRERDEPPTLDLTAVATDMAAGASASREGKLAPMVEKSSNDYRRHIVLNAEAELKKSDPEPYWREVWPPSGRLPYPRHWCGAFFLAMCKRAGIAKDVFWRTGYGLEGAFRKYDKTVRYTRDPLPGDLAYFVEKEHHAMVEKVEGEIVSLIQGNGEGRKVTRTRVLRQKVGLYYSIQPLIDEVMVKDEPPPDTERAPHPRQIKTG